MDDDNNMFLMSRTFKNYHLILSLQFIVPIHKDSSHKYHVANSGYKI
jgi:hypothetical protein